MFFLGKDEGMNLLRTFIYEKNNIYYFKCGDYPAISSRIIIDIKDSFKLAKFMIDLIDKDKKTFLQLTEYGIFPSSQNNHMIHIIRKHYCCEDSLFDKPTTIFEYNERDECATYMQACIVNYVGFSVISKDVIINVSHDSMADLFFPKAKKALVDTCAESYKVNLNYF